MELKMKQSFTETCPNSSTVLMNGREKADGLVKKSSGLMKFIFNREQGTVLGRTALSWAKILAFYIGFYAFLAMFWCACLGIFLSTLDDKVPRYYGKGTIIGINPGVGYQPWLVDDPESTLIKFNIHDNESYKKYVDTLNTILEKYSNTTNTRICEGTQSNDDLFGDESVKMAALNDEGVAQACRFELSEINERGCGNATDFGFKEGQPCVFLLLNRLVAWKPIDYPADSVPEEIRGRYKQNFVTIKCDGTTDFDKERIGNVTYIPEAGIDGRFYPYAVLPNYHQPMAVVKFTNLPRNRVVLVECRAYAQNIEHDVTSKLGLVSFELLIEDMQPEVQSARR